MYELMWGYKWSIIDELVQSQKYIEFVRQYNRQGSHIH